MRNERHEWPFPSKPAAFCRVDAGSCRCRAPSADGVRGPGRQWFAQRRSRYAGGGRGGRFRQGPPFDISRGEVAGAVALSDRPQHPVLFPGPDAERTCPGSSADSGSGTAESCRRLQPLRRRGCDGGDVRPPFARVPAAGGADDAGPWGRRYVPICRGRLDQIQGTCFGRLTQTHRPPAIPRRFNPLADAAIHGPPPA